MATAKEYEILFRLNAQQNSGFAATFNKAQAEFAKLGNEIKGLQKVQSDISSYQKQQKAIEATEKKLENLTKQQTVVRRQIEESKAAGESTAALEREELKLEQQIANTTAALERQREKLDATGERLRSAGADTNDLAKKDEELTGKIKELQARQEEAAKGAQSFGEQSSQAFSAVASAIAAAGIATALHEIYEGYMECINAAGGFVQSMANVEALSGANAAELTELSDLAKELGATTQFTAKQSADAMGYMAMAGWDAQQMLAGMPGVLQLAAASGEDLAQVSDIVTDSMTAFGLTAADTSHYADVLAATATNANTNVAMMGETFKYVAPIAGALGYSVEDMSVAIGMMANAGIKSSMAGTSLRNVISGLSSSVTLTGEAFGEAEITAVRADGSMKGFSATLDELRSYFDQMTEAEKRNNAEAIAGERGYAGLLAILNATDEDYAKLTDTINNCTGAAERMAQIKMDTMTGQLTLMQSAWEAVEVTVGEQFTPTMTELYSIGADVLGEVNEFLKLHPGLVKAGAVLTGGLGALATGILGVNAAIKVWGALNMGALMTTPLGPVLAVTAGVVGLTAAVVGLIEESNAGIPSVKELTEVTRGLHETLQDATDTMEDSAAEMLATSRIADIYIESLESMPDAIGENNERHGEYMNTLQLLVQTVPDLADAINLETGAIEGGIPALKERKAAWEDLAKAEAYQRYLTSLQEAYGDVLLEQAKNEVNLTREKAKAEAATRGMTSTYQKLLDVLGMTDDEFQETYHSMSQLPWRSMGADVRELRDEYVSYADELARSEQSQKNIKEAMEQAAPAIEEAKEAVESANAAYNQLIEAVDGAKSSTNDLADAQAQDLSSAVIGVREQVNALVESYQEAYAAAQQSIEGQYEIWDEAAAVIAVSAGAINNALESQISYWDRYNANLESLRERTSDIEGLSDVIASFADGSSESVNAIASMASASDDELAQMVANWQELQGAQSDVMQSIADLKTDFSNQMDDLQGTLAQDVEAMNLGAEAAAAGEATIQGFIDAAQNMLPQVQKAYDRIGAAAARSLAAASGRNITITTNTRGTTRYLGGTGYAVGTDNALPGYHWVGEQGPELMRFSGGEQVVPAEKSVEMYREYTRLMETLRETFGEKDAESVMERLTEIRGYEVGTNYAAPGVALVGEQGPELMRTTDSQREYEKVRNIIRDAETVRAVIRETDRTNELQQVIESILSTSSATDSSEITIDRERTMTEAQRVLETMRTAQENSKAVNTIEEIRRLSEVTNGISGARETEALRERIAEYRRESDSVTRTLAELPPEHLAAQSPAFAAAAPVVSPVTVEGGEQVTAVSPTLLNILNAHNRYAQTYTDISNALTPEAAPATFTIEAEPAEAMLAPWAEQSKADVAPIQVNVHIHIDGNASPETIHAAQEFGDDIEARMRNVVEDVLENRQIDAGRSWY